MNLILKLKVIYQKKKLGGTILFLMFRKYIAYSKKKGISWTRPV